MSVIFDGKDQSQKHTHLVFVGHRDHGKSSILGRLFYDTGNIGEKAMERIRTMARELGREGFEYAFVMDQIKEERMRGITIGLAHKKLLVDGISFTFADAPGHKDFIKNMLVGASESDATILVIDAKEGIQSQTKEHLYLSKMLGVPRVVVALNKMDLVGYNKEKYQELVKQVTDLVRKKGYDPQEVPIIPCSAIEGENITKKTGKMSWYTGPTFLEVIKNLPSRKIPYDLPLRLPVQDVYSIQGKEWVIGRIETGTLQTGDEILLMPASKPLKVKEMEIRGRAIEKAKPGNNIYLLLEGVEKGEIKRGDICGTHQSPPTVTTKFQAQIMVLNHPTAIKKGEKVVFEMLTEKVPATITNLLRQVDTTTGETKPNPKQINNGESAIVEITIDKPVYIETQSKIPQLSGFRLQQDNKNVAMGICISMGG